MSLIPSLETNFVGTDNDYIAKWNSNFVSILNSFTAVSNALSASFDGTNFLFNEDWTRKPTGYTGGLLIGPDSCILDNTGSNVVTLTNDNSANVSVFWDGSKRRQHQGDLSIGLDSVTVADPSSDTVVYVGVSPSGETDFTGYISLTSGTGYDLYKALLDRSGSTYTLHTVTRLTDYGFNNTLVQDEMDRARIIRLNAPAAMVSWAAAGWRVPVEVPYDHHLLYPFTQRLYSPGGASTATMEFRQVSPDAVTYESSWVSDLNSGAQMNKLLPGSATTSWDGLFMPSGTIYDFNLQSYTGTSIVVGIGVAVVPAHGAPTNF